MTLRFEQYDTASLSFLAFAAIQSYLCEQSQVHSAVDSVLRLEKALYNHRSSTKPYTFAQKDSTLRKVDAEAYAQAYHLLLEGQVKRQMLIALKMIGDC